MKNKLALATASTIAAAGGAAHAQNVPAVYNWTGFYVGLHAGIGTHDASAFDVNAWGAQAVSYVTPFFSSSTQQVVFGGQVGYNWQINAFVAGVEADVTHFGTEKTFVPLNDLLFACGMGCRVSAANELSWMATIRGRAGITFQNILIFGTAGLAVADMENRWGWGDAVSTGLAFGPFSDSQFKKSGTQTGFIYGGGVEVALAQRWLARAELLYVDFGDANVTINSVPYCCAGGTPANYTTRFENEAFIGRLGLNYRW